jgi:hypothetical protein
MSPCRTASGAVVRPVRCFVARVTTLCYGVSDRLETLFVSTDGVCSCTLLGGGLLVPFFDGASQTEAPFAFLLQPTFLRASLPNGRE